MGVTRRWLAFALVALSCAEPGESEYEGPGAWSEPCRLIEPELTCDAVCADQGQSCATACVATDYMSFTPPSTLGYANDPAACINGVAVFAPKLWSYVGDTLTRLGYEVESTCELPLETWAEPGAFAICCCLPG